MALETELKLRIAPEHMSRIRRDPLLKSLSAARATTRRLHSVYYDTPDLYLHRHASALRLRRVGRQWLQTLKGGGGVRAGLHQRNEWETPVHGATLDFTALEASGAPHLPGSVRNKLQPIFVTDFSRTSRILFFEGAEIELSLDCGEIRSGEATRPISELELELKSGKPLQLFRLALVLLETVPLEVEATSKAEYGYYLFAGIKPVITHAPAPDLSRAMDIPTALQHMSWSCLQHLQANVPGAVHQMDDEYLHQARVALRRLRVALGMTNAYHPNDAELAALRREVAALGAELGRSRAWDVFVTETLMKVRAHFPENEEFRRIVLRASQLRQQHHALVRETLQAQSFQRLLLRFGAWMNGHFWRKSQKGTLPDFAAQILEQRSKQVKKYGTQLDRQTGDGDANALHTLRIACKKLRYGAEFFAPLYTPANPKRYLAALTGVQDTLGALNDITVARSLLDELNADAQHEAVDPIRVWLERDYAKRIADLHKGWQKFIRQKAFWE